jgi:hypothetical protein
MNRNPANPPSPTFISVAFCNSSHTSPAPVRTPPNTRTHPYPPFAEGVGASINTTTFANCVTVLPYGSHRYGVADRSVLWCLMATDIFRVMGRASKPISAVQVRELDSVDIALLGEEKGSRAAPLKRLSERHHALARCLASGMEPGDAAITCGYVTSRVSILQADPAFQELLAFYREDVQAKYLDMHGVLAGLSLDAAVELRERLEEDMQANEKKMSVGQLVELTKLGADRTGFGPQSSQLNVNVDLAGRLQAARERVAQRRLAPPDEDIAHVG